MASAKWPDIDKIKRVHVVRAARQWKKNSAVFAFRDSTKFDVLVGDDLYPPKAVSAIAYKLATGNDLLPGDFGGGRGGIWHRMLTGLEFPVLEKSSDDYVQAKSTKLPLWELKALALKESSNEPARVEILRMTHVRSPHVRAYALRVANGECQVCREEGPFVSRKTGKLFLEVHHKTPLSRGGADSIENTVALCPNCHREAHDKLGLGEDDE